MQGIHENSKSSQKVFSLLPITSKLQGIKTQPTMSRVEAAQPLPPIIKHPNFASKTILTGLTMPRALSRQIESPDRRVMSFQRTIMYQKKKASSELMRMKKDMLIAMTNQFSPFYGKKKCVIMLIQVDNTKPMNA